jgi:hypothetical protein
VSAARNNARIVGKPPAANIAGSNRFMRACHGGRMRPRCRAAGMIFIAGSLSFVASDQPDRSLPTRRSVCVQSTGAVPSGLCNPGRRGAAFPPRPTADCDQPRGAAGRDGCDHGAFGPALGRAKRQCRPGSRPAAPPGRQPLAHPGVRGRGAPPETAAALLVRRRSLPRAGSQRVCRQAALGHDGHGWHLSCLWIRQGTGRPAHRPLRRTRVGFHPFCGG